MTPGDHRRERHIAFMERLLDNTLKELEQYKNLHERQEKLKHECKALIEKYNNLMDAYLELEKNYIYLLSLINEGGIN